ncbi:MAG TPA: hypothetical protein VFS05_09940 [Gemmatimonadaceae bacterium]|nr:hypothetical protein [Gemmatimonadaceae bacterium]
MAGVWAAHGEGDAPRAATEETLHAADHRAPRYARRAALARAERQSLTVREE